MMAGGILKNVPFNPATLREVEAYLTGRLLDELSIEDVVPEKLIVPPS